LFAVAILLIYAIGDNLLYHLSHFVPYV
jgi:hypothetical protein